MRLELCAKEWGTNPATSEGDFDVSTVVANSAESAMVINVGVCTVPRCVGELVVLAGEKNPDVGGSGERGGKIK